MRKTGLLLVTVAMVALASCGEKGITPATVKIDGPLGLYFEVVDQPYQVDELGRVNINLKRVKDGLPEPWEKNLVLGAGDNTYEPVFKVAFLDKEGNAFLKDETRIDADEACLRELMDLQVGGIGTVSFITDAEKAYRVKLGSDFTVRIPMDINLSGAIGKKAVFMSLHVSSNGEVKGAYYYKRQGPKALLYLKGYKQDASLSLMEYNKKGDHTGEFRGSLKDSRYFGEFESFRHEKFDIDFQEDKNMKIIDFSQVDFDAFLKKEFYIANAYVFGYHDWEDFLDRYEKQVNSYIAQKKRLENGDENAAKEMASALADYEYYTAVMKSSFGLKGTDQINRCNAIQQRMAMALE